MNMYVVNQSTVLTDAEVKAMVRVVNKQLKDVAFVYDRRSPYLRFARTLPDDPRQFILAILDDSDEANALGYHDETPHGQIYGRVFAKTVLDNNGTKTQGPNSVSVTISHEAIEMFQDPNVNQWIENFQGSEIAVELCDPVEANAYEIEGIWVSDFVFPAYFDVQTTEKQLDMLGKIKRPWAMTAGGYLITRSAGQVSQAFGSRVPKWKKKAKEFPAARTYKREEQ